MAVFLPNEEDITIPLTCRRCIFFEAHATYEKPCRALGRDEDAPTCTRFKPDPRQVGLDRDDMAEAFALMRKVGTRKLPLLAAVIMQAAANKRHGGDLRAGDQVFVRLRAGDYLSNFGAGMLVFIDKWNATVLGHKGFLAEVGRDSILTRSEYEELRERMLRKEQINDPASTRMKVKRHDAASYVAPTIDGDMGLEPAQVDDEERKKKRSGRVTIGG